ncbi:MAG: hypothetical protein SGARI_007406, partial [Bacillariaceae sp.]
VIDFENRKIPCISLQNRLLIVRARNPSEFNKENLTKRLIEAVDCRRGKPVMMPPDFVHHDFAAHYDEEDLERMRLLIHHGADPSHEDVRKKLADRNEKVDDPEGDAGWSKRYRKRLLTEETYEKLKGFGCNIDRVDFELVDTSDERTIPRYCRPRVEEQQESGDTEEDVDEEGDY